MRQRGLDTYFEQYRLHSTILQPLHLYSSCTKIFSDVVGYVSATIPDIPAFSPSSIPYYDFFISNPRLLWTFRCSQRGKCLIYKCSSNKTCPQNLQKKNQVFQIKSNVPEDLLPYIAMLRYRKHQAHHARPRVGNPISTS
jgi:hypothetical protein